MILFAWSFSQPLKQIHPLAIDIRTIQFQHDLLKVTVQISNDSGKDITYLEGFLTEIDQHGKVLAEIRMPFIQNIPFSVNTVHSESTTMPYSEHQFSQFLFHVSKVQFAGDFRVYTYHPSVGLIRID